jgi:hypothetical protein
VVDVVAGGAAGGAGAPVPAESVDTAGACGRAAQTVPSATRATRSHPNSRASESVGMKSGLGASNAITYACCDAIVSPNARSSGVSVLSGSSRAMRWAWK